MRKRVYLQIMTWFNLTNTINYYWYQLSRLLVEPLYVGRVILHWIQRGILQYNTATTSSSDRQARVLLAWQERWRLIILYESHAFLCPSIGQKNMIGTLLKFWYPPFTPHYDIFWGELNISSWISTAQKEVIYQFEIWHVVLSYQKNMTGT